MPQRRGMPFYFFVAGETSIRASGVPQAPIARSTSAGRPVAVAGRWSMSASRGPARAGIVPPARSTTRRDAAVDLADPVPAIVPSPLIPGVARHAVPAAHPERPPDPPTSSAEGLAIGRLACPMTHGRGAASSAR